MASATTDFPLPSTQLTAAGFLSVQKFPEREIISMSGKTSNIRLIANSVDSSWLLVCAEVSGERDYLHVGEDVQHSVDGKLGCLAQHVHSHGVSRTRHKPDVKLSTGHPCVNSLQPRKPARRVEMMLDRLKVGLVLYPTQGISSSDHAGEPNHRSPCHAVIGDRGGHPAPPQRTATSVCACYKAPLCSCHWNLHMSTIQIERSDHSDRDW